MKIEYSTNKIKKQLSSATEIKKAFGVNAKRVSTRLADIEASQSLAVLMKVPAANCHSLSGDRDGEWSVDISANHRMIFVLDHDPIPVNDDGGIDTIRITDIRITETADYH